MKDSEKLQILLKDTCDEDTEIRDLCKQVFPADVVDGDSYAVPSIVDLVEMLVKKLK
jgi:hypothetical protein